jgi:hypothetical protein
MPRKIEPASPALTIEHALPTERFAPGLLHMQGSIIRGEAGSGLYYCIIRIMHLFCIIYNNTRRLSCCC